MRGLLVLVDRLGLGAGVHMPVFGGIPLSRPVLCQLLCPFVLFPPTLVLGMTVDSILVLVGGGPAIGTDVGGLPCIVAGDTGACAVGG